MIDAALYTDLAQRLHHALKIARLVIERATSVQGQLVYQEIPADALLGRLMQLGWRVSLAPEGGGPPQPIGGPDPAQRCLQLVPPIPQADGDDGA
jgi:hypothetical protein